MNFWYIRTIKDGPKLHIRRLFDHVIRELIFGVIEGGPKSNIRYVSTYVIINFGEKVSGLKSQRHEHAVT